MIMTLRGVIFDMDGTLTVPAIDFAEMRRRLNLPQGDMLAEIRRWPPIRRQAAFDVIEEIEERARRALRIQPGAGELLTFLERHGIEKGIMTRNSIRTVEHLLRHTGFSFSEILTRDFEPVKPHPAPVLHICAKWGIRPAEALVVGDYRDDILCGKAAGARTCLLLNPGNAEYASLADMAVAGLGELQALLGAEMP